MNNNQTIKKKYNLEERTLVFTKEIVRLCKKIPNNTVYFKLTDQIMRSASSIGANYREVNDSVGKKDFLHRLKIARKEAKQTTFWLEELLETNSEFKESINQLIDESYQLRNILSTIIKNVENEKCP